MPREHIPLSSTKVRQQPNSSNNVRTYLPIDKLVCIGAWVLGPGLLKPPGYSTGPSPSESGCVWPGLRQWWVGCQHHAGAGQQSPACRRRRRCGPGSPLQPVTGWPSATRYQGLGPWTKI